ncbi:MAG: PQQ-dependent sugar dehydrogenase [Saprospiraceae bacterium]
MKKLVLLSISVLLLVSFYNCQTGGAGTAAVEVAIPETPDPFAAFDSAKVTYTTYCASCHGVQMQAFVDRKWKNGSSAAELGTSIYNGFPDAGMPAWGQVLAEAEIDELVAYIQAGIVQVEKYGFADVAVMSDTVQTKSLTFTIETVVDGMEVPYSMAFLPGGDMLVTERGGEVFRVDPSGKTTELTGVPAVRAQVQGGMHNVLLHPDFANNQYVYLSYGALKKDGGKKLTTTKVSRYKLEGTKLTEEMTILEALPYSKLGYHFGSVMHFDAAGQLFITVGDRGERDVNPQDLSRYGGKIHRVNDDGSIPTDNPFVKNDTAITSIYSYGHRNPQGMDIHPTTGAIWEHEHGPRGGDEINISLPGKNYGWPVISYGLNYDGTTFTNLLEKEGMEQPQHYWVPSIAPSGMTFVTSGKYGDWKGNLLVGSLRYKYLNLVRIEGERIVSEEPLMKNIGRLRFVTEGPDGFIYAGVESPGRVIRLRPLK